MVTGNPTLRLGLV